MKRLGYVFDQVTDFSNLLKAAKSAARGKKRKKNVQEFLFNLENELITLQHELISGNYRPRPYRTFQIYDPKERTISAAPFRDRVVHHAVCRIIEPWFERFFIYDSYACRKGKGTHLALQRAQYFSRKCRFFLKCDIRKFFDSISHDILKNLLERKIKDKNLLYLLNTIIDTAPGNTGLPIGNLTSQHFANLYLDQLDHYAKEKLHFKGYIRYMDDFVYYANDKNSLRQAQIETVDFLENLQLQLNYQATLLRPTWEGLPFLGFRIFPGMCKIKRENWRRFKKKFLKRQEQGKTAPEEAIRSIASLFGHIKHGDTRQLCKQLLENHEKEL